MKKMPWKCSICGRVYAHRNITRREVLNAWWKHTKTYHPALYRRKKATSIRKAIRTKRLRYGPRMRR